MTEPSFTGEVGPGISTGRAHPSLARDQRAQTIAAADVFLSVNCDSSSCRDRSPLPPCPDLENFTGCDTERGAYSFSRCRRQRRSGVSSRLVSPTLQLAT